MIVLEAGTTIRALVEFRDADGQLLDVSNATFQVYSSDKVVISTITSGVTRESEGTYSCMYTTPIKDSRVTYYAEFSGLVGSSTVLVRTPFQTLFDV